MKTFWFALCMMMTSVSWADGSRMNAYEDYVDDTWTLSFGAAASVTNLIHNESSTNTSYTSTNRSVNVPDIKLQLTLMKEFLSSSTISFTAKALGGISDSEGTMGGENLEQYKEKITGTHFGGGLSVNYNIYDFGFKIQPYLGVTFVAESRRYDLSHENAGATLNTIHEVEATVVNPSLGVRIFDADYNLMSYFEVSAPSVMSETVTASGQVNGSTIEIESSTEFVPVNFGVALGFGYYF